MHDTKELEGLGIPAVFVASNEFVTAADAQARSLGFEATPVYTEHPIQDRTDEEMVAIADRVLDEIVDKLVANI